MFCYNFRKILVFILNTNDLSFYVRYHDLAEIVYLTITKPLYNGHASIVHKMKEYWNAPYLVRRFSRLVIDANCKGFFLERSKIGSKHYLDTVFDPFKNFT
jgi:hypothetical protein